MPLQSEHISKAEANEKFVATVAQTAYLDWAVTIIFYSALHYVDAVLAASSVHPDNHTKRSHAIGANATLLTIRPEYRVLETLSKNARYRSIKIDGPDLEEEQKNFEILRTLLRSRIGLTK